MQIFETLAKLADRLRTLAGRGESLLEGHVVVQLPDGSQHHIREIQPSGVDIVLIID